MATTTDLILLQYLDILEKTNQQLGLWSNPYGVMVAVLSFLIAVLAIVFGVILWRQGKEYQKKFDNFLNELKKNANVEFAKMSESRKLNKIAIKRFEKEINEKSKKLTTVTGKAKEKLEKEIRDIQEIKESLNKTPVTSFLGSRVISDENSCCIPTATIPSISEASAGICGQNKCKKCGRYYDANLPSTSTVWTLSGDSSSGIECPYCGNFN